MSTHKRRNTKDPFQNIQKTSDVINNINNYYDPKKPKYSNTSYTSAFVLSLNNNPYILKIACYNVVSFVNPTK